MGNPSDSNTVQGAGEVTPEVMGSEEAFGRFLPEARGLDASGVIPFRADAALAYHNANRGVEEQVPALQSRLVTPRKATAAPPTPAPGRTPA